MVKFLVSLSYHYGTVHIREEHDSDYVIYKEEAEKWADEYAEIEIDCVALLKGKRYLKLLINVSRSCKDANEWNHPEEHGDFVGYIGICRDNLLLLEDDCDCYIIL